MKKKVIAGVLAIAIIAGGGIYVGMGSRSASASILNASEIADVSLDWIQLDQLKTYNQGFRQDFDTLFNINIVTENSINGKSGCLFVGEENKRDGNTTIADAIRNKVFMTKYYNNEATLKGIKELASTVYTDVESDSTNAVYAGLSAYYNLFGETSEFNASQTLTRGDYYSLVFRSENGVQDLKADTAFQTATGDTSDESLYASQVDEYGWLNIDNSSLTKGNYNGSITRAEAVYTLMSKYFNSELSKIDTNKIKLDDAKNANDMNVGSESGYQLKALTKMVEADNGKVHVDIYKALGLAESLGIIESETRWNEPVTKAEAVDLIIKTQVALNARDGYLTTVEYGEIDLNAKTSTVGAVGSGVVIDNAKAKEIYKTLGAMEQVMCSAYEESGGKLEDVVAILVGDEAYKAKIYSSLSATSQKMVDESIKYSGETLGQALVEAYVANISYDEFVKDDQVTTVETSKNNESSNSNSGGSSKTSSGSAVDNSSNENNYTPIPQQTQQAPSKSSTPGYYDVQAEIVGPNGTVYENCSQADVDYVFKQYAEQGMGILDGTGGYSDPQDGFELN